MIVQHSNSNTNVHLRRTNPQFVFLRCLTPFSLCPHTINCESFNDFSANLFGGVLMNRYTALEIEEAVKEVEELGLGDFLHQDPRGQRSSRRRSRRRTRRSSRRS
ncbi:CotG/ExsB N-terminal domain-containing protein, partial [Neobacillus fumarioli]|uniref:CotG/ExsB N-terminal domain-containing protein n=1 Tax=Neobacillus fumarioli TaxID=105229 RepID=UPI003F772BD9